MDGTNASQDGDIEGEAHMGFGPTPTRSEYNGLDVDL